MNRLFKLKIAKQTAEKLLRDENIEALPVDPFAIAASRGIEVRAKPDTVDGVSGMLLRHGNSFGIMYATHISSEGFQRFSVAHELGHYFLEGHLDAVFANGNIHQSNAGFTSTDPYEMEADQFAAALLMPSGPFKRILGRRDPGLATVEHVSRECRTSLTAAAIRVAELTQDAVAVAISTGPTIDYCFMSEAMKSLPGLSWVRKGMAVPVGTATATFNRDRSRVLAADRMVEEVSSVDWLGGSRAVTLVEEVIGLGGYAKTLTVLSSHSLALTDEGYEDDAEEERSLIESYTPRFRR